MRKGRLEIGSPEHRDLFCRSFIDTHVAFEPASLAWPRLEGHHLELIRAFPFWSFALSIEREAGRMVDSFAKTVTDPLIREAIALQGYEESRHGRLLAHVLERYEIDAPEIVMPAPPAQRDDFLLFGFGECSDSFVGFGGFALARQKNVFPEQLMDIFEHILFEEARHITFFINWWRYEEALAGRTNPITRLFRALRYHVRAAMKTAKGAQSTAPGEAPPKLDLTGGSSQVLLDGVTPLTFLQLALGENRRMMARLDRRLPKPHIVPRLATALLLGLRMLPPRTPVPAPAADHPDLIAR
jgi:hypothetical protein